MPYIAKITKEFSLIEHLYNNNLKKTINSAFDISGRTVANAINFWAVRLTRATRLLFLIDLSLVMQQMFRSANSSVI